MKNFVFRKGYLGFQDWCHSINRMRREIQGYLSLTSEEMKELRKESFKEAKRWYELYLAYMKELTDGEREYVKSVERHHIPSRSLNVDLEKMVLLWERMLDESGLNALEELDPVEFGKRITEARENKGYSRDQVAEILGISRETLKLYEKGLRGVPYSVVFKLNQFLERIEKKSQ